MGLLLHLGGSAETDPPRAAPAPAPVAEMPGQLRRPAFGFLPWFALLRRALSLRLFVFFDTVSLRRGTARLGARPAAGHAGDGGFEPARHRIADQVSGTRS